jgi:hypothetical protein
MVSTRMAWVILAQLALILTASCLSTKLPSVDHISVDYASACQACSVDDAAFTLRVDELLQSVDDTAELHNVDAENKHSDFASMLSDEQMSTALMLNSDLRSIIAGGRFKLVAVYRVLEKNSDSMRPEEQRYLSVYLFIDRRNGSDDGVALAADSFKRVDRKSHKHRAARGGQE